MKGGQALTRYAGRPRRRATVSRVLLAVALLAATDAHAGPELDPGTFYHYLGPKQSSRVVSVRNLGDATAFVRVQSAELTFDAAGEAHERPLDEESGFSRVLLVTPPRLIIAAQGAQSVRFIYRGPRVVERYFRLRYVPVAPQAHDDFALQPEEASAYADALSAGVGVLKAIGTIVIMSPSQPRYATRLVPGEQALRIINEGNATVRLDRVQACKVDTEVCAPAPGLHIRPGQEGRLEHRNDEVYRFELREGPKRSSHVYPQAGRS